MLVSSAQMRELDRRTIELGTPGLTLMERAGKGIARYLVERQRAACRRGVLVLCGRGNNGGDGFVVARLLTKAGFRQEGLARRYLLINGVWSDHVQYALLEDEYRANAASG